MTTETLKVTKLPKSKMQAVREYTPLRAFVEIDEDGNPIAYFIETITAVKTANRKPLKKTTRDKAKFWGKRIATGPRKDNTPRVGADTQFRYVKSCRHEFTERSQGDICAKLINKKMNTGKTFTRRELLDFLQNETGYPRTGLTSLVSKITQLGGIEALNNRSET